MKRITWIVLGVLGIHTAAQAVSFDCSKATSKVEIMICGDAGLSQLDEDLSSAYKAVLHDEKQSNIARQSQKQWIKLRNTCQDSACVKSSYEERLVALNSLSAQGSYFVDTPARSVDEELNGCFSDRDCSAQAKLLIPLFAKQRGMNEADVRNILDNCLSPDRNMSFCVSYELFAVRFELDQKLNSLGRTCDKACNDFIQQKHSEWSKSVTTRCEKEAALETQGGGGLYEGELIVSCEFEATKSKILSLRKVTKCSPVSLCS